LALPTLIFFGIDIVRFGLDLLAAYGLYLALSLSLNLEFGYTGIPNFGKVLYVAAGAAIAGSFSGRFAAWALGINGDFLASNFQIVHDISIALQKNVGLSILVFLLTLLVAAGMGGFLGFITTYPAIRLREDYLAMLLLGMAQFFQIFLGNYTPLINGSFGVLVPNPFGWAGQYSLTIDTVVLVIFAVAVYIYLERIARSPLGRALKAIRDNEDASKMVGKNDVKIRRNVLIIASIISAVAGALWTIYLGDVSPGLYGRVLYTFWPWVMVIIGGTGNNFGVAIGVFAFVFGQKVLDLSRLYVQNVIPVDVNWIEYVVFGVLLIVILYIRPEGIIREKPTPTLRRSVLRKLVERGSRGSNSVETKKEEV
jgi:branched-chain amino acid transport system permease protein